MINESISICSCQISVKSKKSQKKILPVVKYCIVQSCSGLQLFNVNNCVSFFHFHIISTIFYLACSAMLSKLLVSTSLTLVTYASTNDELEIEEDAYIYHSSCLNLDDGEHTLKLLDGDLSEFPLVNVECNNGYTILDVSKDDDLIKYFNTFQKYHRSVAGPTNNVLTNWEGWYLPDDGLTNYIISPDCNSCDDTHIRQIHKNDENGIFKTTYMMTGTMFGCFWNLKGEHNFDQVCNLRRFEIAAIS